MGVLWFFLLLLLLSVSIMYHSLEHTFEYPEDELVFTEPTPEDTVHYVKHVVTSLLPRIRSKQIDRFFGYKMI